MTDSPKDKDALIKKANVMAREGRTITEISGELGINWHEARSYLNSSSWLGAKVKITNRLKELVKEPDQNRREKISTEADRYVDFLFDAAKHLRNQVDGARKALNR